MVNKIALLTSHILSPQIDEHAIYWTKNESCILLNRAKGSNVAQINWLFDRAVVAEFLSAQSQAC